MKCQDSRFKNPRFKAPSNFKTFCHVNRCQKDWCGSDAKCQSQAQDADAIHFNWATPQAGKVTTTTTTTTTGCGSRSCSRNGYGDKGSNYSCKNIHQCGVSPLSEVCRCADVAIILPNKAESHSVALPRNKKRTTTEDWRHLLQERWRVWGGRGVTHTELRSH